MLRIVNIIIIINYFYYSKFFLFFILKFHIFYNKRNINNKNLL